MDKFKKTLFIFHRDLRLYDNTGLINIDKLTTSIIPSFIFDPKQLNAKYKSNNCIQFMVESLIDLNKQLEKYNSHLYTFYGIPWKIVKNLIVKDEIDSVCLNIDYSIYSRYRENKIKKVCNKYKIPFIYYEDILLNNINTIKTTSDTPYKVFTPFYNNAKLIKIKKPINHKYKNLKKVKLHTKQYNSFNELYNYNKDLYINGGRLNALKIIKNIKKFKKYNKYRNIPSINTTLLSPHNKFGTVSIRELYYIIRSNLSSKNELLKQLYWRDFYYNQIYFFKGYGSLIFDEKYNKIKWKNDKKLLNKWKNGDTNIPLVDSAMKQLNKTGWIHNRLRMIVASVLTKVYHIDWRLGERYFKEKLVDYDITQNIMNWAWISSEASFSNPYFKTLNPISQTKRFDPKCEYIQKWINIGNCSKSLNDKEIEKYVKKQITYSTKLYSKY